MLRFVRLVTVVLLSLFVGCSDSTGPVSLSLNRARWEKQDLHEYIYTGRRVCFFCPNAGQDVYVLVLADTVFSARVVGTTVELPKGEWLTVDQLFDFARSSYENYETVRVEYHPELGYPTLINLSCSRDVLDCGMSIEIKNLGDLPSIE